MIVSRGMVLVLVVGSLAACLSSTPVGPGGTEANLRLTLVSGNAQSDSVLGRVDGILLRLEAEEGEELGPPPQVVGIRMAVTMEGSCERTEPADLVTENGGDLAFSVVFSEISGECDIVVSANRDDPSLGPAVTVTADALPGRPVTELIPPGTGLSAPTTLMISSEARQLFDAYLNPIAWELELLDEGSFLLLDDETPSGVDYFLTAIGPDGVSELEVSTMWGGAGTLDVFSCQDGGATVVHVFNPTPLVPTPGCGGI